MNNQKKLFDLVSSYETMTRSGNQIYLEQTTYNRLIDYYERELLYDKAIKVAELAISHYPFTVDFLLRRVHLYIFNKQIDRANWALEQAEALSPNSLDVQVHRAWIMAENGNFKMSLQLLDDLKNDVLNFEDSSVICLYEALVYEKMQLLERMFYALKEALELDYNNMEALEKLWWCMERASKYDECIGLCKKIVDQNPYSFWGWFILANAYEYMAFYDKAIEAYDFVLVINENFEMAYRNCAEICMNLKRYDQALKYYQEVLDRYEHDSDIFLRVGICYLKLGKIQPAKKFLLMAKEEDDFNDEIFYYLGECFAAEKNWTKAQNHFRKAIRLYSQREEYHFGLAGVYEATGQLELAERHYQRGCDLGAETTSNWLTWGAYLLRHGKVEQAMRVLEDARELCDEMSLKYYHVACLLKSGRRSEAIYYLGEALEEDFEKYTVLFSLLPECEHDEEISNYIFSTELSDSIFNE